MNGFSNRTIGTLMGIVGENGEYAIHGIPPKAYEIQLDRMVDGESDAALGKLQEANPLRAQVSKDQTTFDVDLKSSP